MSHEEEVCGEADLETAYKKTFGYAIKDYITLDLRVIPHTGGKSGIP